VPLHVGRVKPEPAMPPQFVSRSAARAWFAQ